MNLSQIKLKQEERLLFLIMGVMLALGLILYVNLEALAQWLTFTVIGLPSESPLGQALSFFLYDVPKIMLLLASMTFAITFMQTFINTEKIRQLVEKRGEGIGNLMAAVFGTITPFCSCSSVPLFIGFIKAGIPLGITFSFLITSPIMNEVAFVLLLGLFGWQVALMYLVSGITIGVVAGIILGRMKLEGYVEDFVYKIKAQQPKGEVLLLQQTAPTWHERFQQAYQETREIVSKVWLFVVIGIGIGAFIHGFVPQDALTSIMGESAWWSVPVVVVLGIPLYGGAVTVIPIVSAMLGKGAALGTVLAFMMSVVALSLPEMIILRKVLKPRLIAIFIGTVALGIITTGYLFNVIM